MVSRGRGIESKVLLGVLDILARISAQKSEIVLNGGWGFDLFFWGFILDIPP